MVQRNASSYTSESGVFLAHLFLFISIFTAIICLIKMYVIRNPFFFNRFVWLGVG